MNGLAVIFHRDGRPVDPGLLDRMVGATAHRGLDGSATAVRSSVGLGFARTVVSREDALGVEPYVSPRSGSIIIADARLDNREELLARLPGPLSSATSDAELILLAYETQGVPGFAWLLGDFAFLIWDALRRQVIAARDPSGERPLHYRIGAGEFAAASEIPQLLQDPAVEIQPNEDRIRAYLTPHWVYRNDRERAETFFEGIHTVPAGQAIVVGESGHTVRRFWELAAPAEIRYRDDRQYAQHFADVFVSALRARLRTAHPIAAALSGGLDSTSIVSLAHLLFERGLAENSGFTTYSMTFDGLECDESGLIRDVQARYGFDARGYSPLGVVANLDPEPRGFLARPMKSPGEIDPILALAARGGARTLLTGHLGDNCFGWSSRFFDSLLRRGHLVELLRQVSAYRAISGESLRRVVALYCLLPLAPVGLQKSFRRALARREFSSERDSLVPDWIPGDLRDDLLRCQLTQVLDVEQHRRFAGVEREIMYASLYPPEAVPIAGAHPVQLVRPFSDRRLHELVLALPPEQLFQPHPYAPGFFPGSKLILRRAMRGILPESVRARTQKPHFTSLVRDEIRARWPDYHDAFGDGGDAEIARRGYVDRAAFWRRLERMRAGEFGEDGVYVLRLLNLETWLRTFRLPRARQLAPQTWPIPDTTTICADHRPRALAASR